MDRALPVARDVLGWPVLIGAAVLVGFWLLSPVPGGSDAHNYYALDLSDPYRNRWFDFESFVYSPAIGQLIYPFTQLPIDGFYKLLQGINVLCLAWLLGPVWAAAALLLPPVQAELTTNNIHLPLAVMCVIGFRYPAAWAFGLLTKVTPGIALGWHLARGEWRELAMASLTTIGVVAVSALLMTEAWADWMDLLLESPTRTEAAFALNDWPVVFRLPIAFGLVVMASWKNRPAALPVIVCFALPAIWPWSLTLLAAVPRIVASPDPSPSHGQPSRPLVGESPLVPSILPGQTARRALPVMMPTRRAFSIRVHEPTLPQLPSGATTSGWPYGGDGTEITRPSGSVRPEPAPTGTADPSPRPTQARRE